MSDSNDNIISILIQFKQDGDLSKAQNQIEALKISTAEAAESTTSLGKSQNDLEDGLAKVEKRAESVSSIFETLERKMPGLGELFQTLLNGPDLEIGSQLKTFDQLIEKIQKVKNKFHEPNEQIQETGASNEKPKAIHNVIAPNNANHEPAKETTNGVPRIIAENGTPRNIEHQTRQPQIPIVSAQEQERITRQFESDSRVISEFERLKSSYADLTRPAVAAVAEMLQIMKDHADLLKGLVKLPEAIAELRARQEQLASQLQSHGP